MNNLAVKEVNFDGDILMAAQKKDNRKIYVAVRWVCQGLGLTDDQVKRQVKNVQKDIVISQGVSILTLPTKGGVQDVICIELDYLPLWLAKIAITPNMKKTNPETVSKLIDYQIKAKDVLANAFVHDVAQLVPKNYKEALIALVESIEEKEKLEVENLIMKPKAEIHDQIVAAVNAVDMIITAKSIGIGEKKLFEFLRVTKVLFKRGSENYPYQQYQNKGYFEVKTKTKVDKYGRTSTQELTKVTGKGKVFILNLVNNYGGAKVINKLKLSEISEHVNNYEFK